MRPGSRVNPAFDADDVENIPGSGHQWIGPNATQNVGYGNGQQFRENGPHTGPYVINAESGNGSNYVEAPPRQTINRGDTQFSQDQYMYPSHRGPIKEKALWLKITGRIFSLIFILGDMVFDWLELTLTDLDSERDWSDWFSNIEALKKLSLKDKFCTVNCEVYSPSLPTIKIVFCVIGSCISIVQIINMIGETLQEINKGKDTKYCRGFQFVHGWIDTCIALFGSDLPDLILVVVFSTYCSVPLECAAIIFGGKVLSLLKNTFRYSTCKQEPKPGCCQKGCCEDCCKDCCVYEYFCDCVPFCRIFRFTLCGHDRCCKLDTINYEICPGCCWKRGCFNETEKDPKWAEQYVLLGTAIYSSFQTILIFLAIAGYFGLDAQIKKYIVLGSSIFCLYEFLSGKLVDQKRFDR